MAKTYTCRDVGVDCDWKVGGGVEAEAMRKYQEPRLRGTQDGSHSAGS